MNLCCSKIACAVNDWDELVPSELVKEWNTATRNLRDIESLPFPRRRVPFEASENCKFAYHMFTDISKDTAAAAVYLRVQDGDKYDVNLVAAKTSVFSEAEMARKSIPQKELSALDLGSRLLKECISSTSLPIENFELWSDSKTVIQWCSEASLELRVFERNRVDSILRNSQGKSAAVCTYSSKPCRCCNKAFQI